MHFQSFYWVDSDLDLPKQLNGILENGATSSVVPFQFMPATPNLQKQMNNQPVHEQQFLANDILCPEKSKEDDDVFNQPPEIIERKHDELDCSPGTSSAAILASPNGKVNSDYRKGGIDLNKTPPQRTPKRKKHRPKVIVEGKAKRTPKSATPRNRTADKYPTEKSKHEHRRGARTSTTLLSDVVEVEASNAWSTVKSCRRALNFNLENVGGKNSQPTEALNFNLENGAGKNCQTAEVGNLALDDERCSVPLNFNCHNTEGIIEFNKKSTSTLNEWNMIENLYNCIQSVKDIPPSELSWLSTTPSPPASNCHTLNIIARSLNVKSLNAKQNGGHNHFHQLMSGDLTQLVTKANSYEPNPHKMKRQPDLPTRTQLLDDLVAVKENQGCKRKYSHTELRQPQTVSLMGSQLWFSNTNNASRDNSKIWLNVSETIKKRKIEDIIHYTASNMSSRITTVEDYTGQMENTEYTSPNVQSSAVSLNDDGLPKSEITGLCTSRNQNDELNKVSCEWNLRSKDFKHKFRPQHIPPLFQGQQMAQKFQHLNQTQNTNSLATVTNWDLESASQRDPTAQDEVVNSHACVSNKKLVAGTKSDKSSGKSKMLQQLITHTRRRGRPKKFTGAQELLPNLFSVDDIIDQMKNLNINNSGQEVRREGQTALVPYRGDGSIVSYDAFDPIKKLRQRPKVDLDSETNRLWNLLMGKEGSESTETMGDDDKQKWWEKERKVLRNRADSFIARMHLVQGDRRFSKWKGSVVDSVIGVFLTQNVSDHLSSSAFMYLASKYPIKLTAVRESCCQNGQSPLIGLQKVHISYPDGTSYDHRMMREPVCNPISVTSSETSECGREYFATRTYILDDNTKKIEEDMISSQGSSESLIFQASEDIRSSLRSNSEADQITKGNSSKDNGPSSLYEQAERLNAFKQYQLQVMGSSFPMPGHQQFENPMHLQNLWLTTGGNACAHPFASDVPCYRRPVPLPTSLWPNMSKGLENWQMDILKVPGKESMSAHSFASSVPLYQRPVPPPTRFEPNKSKGLENWERDFLTVPGKAGKESISSMASTYVDFTNRTDVKHRHEISGLNVGSNYMAQQIGRPEIQQSTTYHGIMNECSEQLYLSACSQSGMDQHFVNYRKDGNQEAFQLESTFLPNHFRPVEAFSKVPIDNQKDSEDIVPEQPEKSQVYSSNSQSSKLGTKISLISKQKREKDKKKSFNWDSLRKKAQSESGMRARSTETMDSIDYDALRNADVREISETIKERGMNNMLAERIKDFLNRLIQEHGKIDLEWLREVQPDKVKDYLLSIRGLGLKSVECVRLLTLHNVAFPVDTNVGRIAVRLGWVPLQPLPESLQLHLLELYPVLESIQKYLWPRLCHLDQETLFELHYQMITFGKVFCTKRNPNCNACPMRGECRHFASAYASSRLALPASEERQIVCSSEAASADKIFGMILNPMRLPLAEDNLKRGMDSVRNNEPIIEEPKTPDPHAEVIERDMEDAYYEDPNDIPVIKLNIEEFTTNLQSFIQEKEEMNGDMSKALVVLNPNLASIPVPKLKNVSRLRTEHQVYELPDSHPVLKRLDKREPDDPSPYLLAIWTPGETSDSVQPPDSRCSYQGGSLCNEETCFSCSSTREKQAQTVRGTILIPCRTAMRGSFPLNGTYFQVNEVFADHESSMNPIVVLRSLLWNLPRRRVFFGTSATTIFKGLTTEDIQYCFWKGFVCVRGFDQKNRAPRPLSPRLHLPASKMVKPSESR